MPAKPLTPEQKADAERLMAIFKRQQGLTQAVLADELGFSNQSAVSQYLKGKIPLNVDAAIKFATKFGCAVSEFSPLIQAEIDRIAQHAVAARSDGETVSSNAVSNACTHTLEWKKYSTAPNEKQAVVDFILQDDGDKSPEWVDSDARAYADSLEAKARRWLSGKNVRGTKKASA